MGDGGTLVKPRYDQTPLLDWSCSYHPIMYPHDRCFMFSQWLLGEKGLWLVGWLVASKFWLVESFGLCHDICLCMHNKEEFWLMSWVLLLVVLFSLWDVYVLYSCTGLTNECSILIEPNTPDILIHLLSHYFTFSPVSLSIIHSCPPLSHLKSLLITKPALYNVTTHSICVTRPFNAVVFISDPSIRLMSSQRPTMTLHHWPTQGTPSWMLRITRRPSLATSRQVLALLCSYILIKSCSI